MALTGELDKETGLVDIWECGNYFDYTYCDELGKRKILSLNKQFHNVIDDIKEYRKQRRKTRVAKFMLENKIISAIKSNKNLMYLCEIRPYFALNKRDDCWISSTIPYECLKSGLLRVVDFALNDDRGACVPCGINRSTLAMECIRDGKEDLALIAINNPNARIQVDKFGQNLGMVAVDSFVKSGVGDRVICECLKHDDCSTQQRYKDGRNIGGMIAGVSADNEDKLCRHIECLSRAFNNEKARAQLDKDGNNMLEILKCHHKLRQRIVLCGPGEDVIGVFRHANNRYGRLISLYESKYNDAKEMND